MGKPINVEVKPRDRNESFERMVRRFVKKTKKEKVLEKYRERMYYEKPSIKRKKERLKRKKLLDKLRIEREKNF
jgi:ribosomal protein S21|tara:strand:+ start:976 stop:1197 length:222 start_codon:yes stop_codon:yes gene_type:complete